MGGGECAVAAGDRGREGPADGGGGRPGVGRAMDCAGGSAVALVGRTISLP